MNIEFFDGNDDIQIKADESKKEEQRKRTFNGLCASEWAEFSKLSKSSINIRKLNAIISSEDQIASLKKLSYKIINNDFISMINIGISGKGSIMPTGAKLDYVMLFDLENDNDGVAILWSIGVINIKLVDVLKPLLNDSGEMRGSCLCSRSKG